MKPALLIMDFENDVVHENGKFAAFGFNRFLVENKGFDHLSAVIQKARAKNVPIIHVRVGYSPDFKEWPSQSPIFGPVKEMQATILGQWGTEFHQSIDVKENDFIVTKYRISPFYSTSLETILRNLKIDTLYLCGVSTDWVVQSAAREAHDRDYQLVLLEDCCGASSMEEHQRALSSLKLISIICRENKVLFEDADLIREKH